MNTPLFEKKKNLKTYLKKEHMTSLSKIVLCCIFFHDFLIQFSLERKIEEGIRRIEEEEKKKRQVQAWRTDQAGV